MNSLEQANLKLECLKLAQTIYTNHTADDLIKEAKKLFDFITNYQT